MVLMKCIVASNVAAYEHINKNDSIILPSTSNKDSDSDD